MTSRRPAYTGPHFAHEPPNRGNESLTTGAVVAMVHEAITHQAPSEGVRPPHHGSDRLGPLLASIVCPPESTYGGATRIQGSERRLLGGCA